MSPTYISAGKVLVGGGKVPVGGREAGKVLVVGSGAGKVQVVGRGAGKVQVGGVGCVQDVLDERLVLPEDTITADGDLEDCDVLR